MSLTSRWDWVLRQAARKLWLTVVFYILAALLSVLLGALLEPLLPERFLALVTADSADRVLGILASSMLAVTTFSLATMVTAHAAVTSNTSPRATTLVLDNEVTRHALGVFIGTFLFSLVGIVALKTQLLGSGGHVVLFIITLAVIALIIVALLRWIEHLSQLVRVSETTDRVEAATRAALQEWARHPGLGAMACADMQARLPDGSRAVRPLKTGYVRHIDMQGLIALADSHKVDVYVQSPPGAFVGLQTSLVYLAGEGAGVDVEAAVRELFAIGTTRTFDYDPRFGLIVLGEIASRALSPGINDPGTAIDVIGRAVRLFSRWAGTSAERSKASTEPGVRVWMPELSLSDMLDDVFTPIARDGASSLPVQMRLQKGLGLLTALGHAPLRAAAEHQSRRAWAYAERALAMDFERDALLPQVPGLAGRRKPR